MTSHLFSRDRFCCATLHAGCCLLLMTSVLVLVTFAQAEEPKPPLAGKHPEAKLEAERINLNFTRLSFMPARDPVDARTGQPHYLDQAPDTIKAYDGCKVRIRGYMMPTKLEGNDVREFMILASQMSCCYGTPPRFWEFILAKKTGDAVPNLMDTPLTFEGVLKVGDVYENGYWTQFYTLECTDAQR